MSDKNFLIYFNKKEDGEVSFLFYGLIEELVMVIFLILLIYSIWRVFKNSKIF